MPPSPEEPYRGRRGNGLSAQEWGALVDVDPRLSEQLLDRLAAAEVAAQVEPAGATTDPVSRAGHLPSRPLDRLWVDVARADAARDVVEAQAGELVASLSEGSGLELEQFLHAVPRGASGRVLKPPPSLLPRSSGRTADPQPAEGPAQDSTADSDAAWQAIIAGYERPVETPVPPWPVEEDVPDTPKRRRTDAEDAAPPRRRDRPAATDGGLPGWLEPDALPDDGAYVPPPPPPPPRVKPRTVGAVAAIVLGVLLLFAPGLLGVAPEGQTYLLGMALMAGGAGALVYWMRDAPGSDGPDDGAVV